MKNREIIAITDEGTIIVPDNPSRVRMTIAEIARLLGIYDQTARRHIRAIEQSGIAEGDYSMRCIVDRHGVHSDYYGLEMIAVVAFRVKSWQADKFRQWLMERVTRPERNHGLTPPISIIVPVRKGTMPN
jgi:hypothetical protein